MHTRQSLDEPGRSHLGPQWIISVRARLSDNLDFPCRSQDFIPGAVFLISEGCVYMQGCRRKTRDEPALRVYPGTWRLCSNLNPLASTPSRMDSTGLEVYIEVRSAYIPAPATPIRHSFIDSSCADRVRALSFTLAAPHPSRDDPRYDC